MYVRIKSLDGSKNCILVVSKKTKVTEIKSKIEENLDVPKNKQRLFYKGKQLENQYSLFDYDVKLFDVIQLMITIDADNLPATIENVDKENAAPNSSSPPSTSAHNEEGSKETLTEEDITMKSAQSKYYNIGDYVDVVEEITGSWFESQITDILVNKDKDEYEDVDLKFKVIHLRYKDEGSVVTFHDIRPVAKQLIKKGDLLGTKVMGNFNYENPKEIGYWYDMLIGKVQGRRSTDITATVYIGTTPSGTKMEDCKIKFIQEFYKVEYPKLISERLEEDERHMTTKPETLRKIVPECKSCDDDDSQLCKDCGCSECAGKEALDKLLVCEECQSYYHIWCLKPPLESIPEDDWFCPGCKRDTSEIVAPGQKLKASKKKAKMASATTSSKRDWGKGMACVGRTKVCDIVPSDHFGPIPGIEVGQSYLYRVQMSEAGLHRPHVAGIHGREDTGAFSIVLSGGYEDDVDNGDSFHYTGSGGRDLSGNKRTSCQSFDQKLTRMNKALAKNCNAPINDEGGNEAIDWKKGKPVRVIRSAKAAKHSKYAPAEGNRYDGIYKVVNYHPAVGSSKFLVWKFLLRRDDEVPAPWTEEGKERIKELGLQMVYPDGYEEAQAAKDSMKTESTKRKLDTKSDDKESTMAKKAKKSTHWMLPPAVVELMSKDTIHKAVWEEVKNLCKDGQKKILDFYMEKFRCIICQEIVHKPITLDCVHSFCHDCLCRHQNTDSETSNQCPHCGKKIDKSVLESHFNKELQSILSLLFPGYGNSR